MITLDGAMGEGGGQIVRTSLSLSLITGKPFRIENLRARRAKPGLLRQHLTAVTAAARLGRAEVAGAELRSRSLEFRPRGIEPGHYLFDIGSAGSANLVVQTLLPALLCAPGPSTVEVRGGTYNPTSPPFDFLAEAFLPVLRAQSAQVSLRIQRPGFYPAGGGSILVEVTPASALRPLSLPLRESPPELSARALVSRLPLGIAERELGVIAERLAIPSGRLHAEIASGSPGPGNVVMIFARSSAVTEVFTGFGQRGVRAEEVAEAAVSEARSYLLSRAAAGEHLADQLLIPLALAGRGYFTASALSSHAVTNIEVIRRFLDVDFEIESGVDYCTVRL